MNRTIIIGIIIILIIVIIFIIYNKDNFDPKTDFQVKFTNNGGYICYVEIYGYDRRRTDDPEYGIKNKKTYLKGTYAINQSTDLITIPINDRQAFDISVDCQQVFQTYGVAGEIGLIPGAKYFCFQNCSWPRDPCLNMVVSIPKGTPSPI